MALPPLPNVLIIGATGVTGAELLDILESRGFPHGMLRLAGSRAIPGRTVDYCGTRVPVDGMDEGLLTDVDLVFLAAGGDVSRQWGRLAADRGATVIDLSSAFRMDPDVPLVVPEINADALPAPDLPGGALIANPNCSTIITLMAVTPIHALAPVERMVACTYQAASGGGRAMMEELEQQARDWVAGDPPTTAVTGRRYHFNLFSHDSPIGPEGGNEEEAKLGRESSKILDAPDLRVAATCVRVPVLRAHSIAVHLELAAPVSVAAARDAIAAAPGVAIVDDADANRFPEPIDAAGGDDVLAGRLRRDASVPDDRGLALFVCGDQLRKGAALNAVQIAETLMIRAGHRTPEVTVFPGDQPVRTS